MTDLSDLLGFITILMYIVMTTAVLTTIVILLGMTQTDGDSDE